MPDCCPTEKVWDFHTCSCRCETLPNACINGLMFDEAVCDCVPCVTYECAENETWNEEFCHCAPNDCTEAWAVF